MHRILLFSVFFLYSAVAFGQNIDTLVRKTDTLITVDTLAKKVAEDSLAKKLGKIRRMERYRKPANDINKFSYTKETNFTPKSYFVLLGTDLEQEFTGPFHAPKKTWLQVGGFAVLEGALFFADESIKKFAVEWMRAHPGAKNVSQDITNFGGVWEGYTLAVFGAYGFIAKDNKVKTTTLLATQSYLAAGAMSYIAKFFTGRQRPNVADRNTIFRGPYFDNSTSLNSSLPSGHTTAAFSAATVFAEEYKGQIVYPIIAYTTATLVGLSRITQNAHWATDIFAGAALGYVTGRQVSYNYHRYQRLKSGKVKTSFLFNLQYQNGVIMPGLVCRF